MTLKISEMGSKGEGTVHGEHGPVHVPFTLPGETINAAVNGTRGTLMALLEASPDRVKPVCTHFEACGGCSLQHWALDAQLEWKRQLVSDALKQRGIEIEVGNIIAANPGERRRAVYSVREEKGRKLVGFNAAHSHTIIPIEECAVVVPQLVAALPMVRALANLMPVKKDGGHITVTATTSGLDVSMTGVDKISTDLRTQMSNFAVARDLARLSIAEDIIVEVRRPIIHFGSVAVSPPPGGFLQACASVESAMAAEVTAHFAKSKNVADLFSGSGAFAFQIAKAAPVHAIEGDAAAVASIDRGRRGLQGFKAITVEQRDLFRRPLILNDLKAYDAVIFDPPRAGAEDQSKMLAKSKVKKIAAVSCNPATLARDLRILIDGGYALKSVTPYDQFLWSPHVEAVALLVRN
ncbi:MAG: class I SAM-dependent RNA methyltransferase [Rhizobiaceae bacterium]